MSKNAVPSLHAPYANPIFDATSDLLDPVWPCVLTGNRSVQWQCTCLCSCKCAAIQDKIGIRKHHCTVIASDIKQKVDEETAEEGGASTSKASKRVTLCMEGNISAGKSTFLQWVASGNPELEEILEVCRLRPKQWLSS